MRFACRIFRSSGVVIVRFLAVAYFLTREQKKKRKKILNVIAEFCRNMFYLNLCEMERHVNQVYFE